MSTDNTPTAALCDHLLPSMLVAQHCAANVDRHKPVEALHSDFIDALSGPEYSDKIILSLLVRNDS